MGADDLVCAACGGRVGDARCATCRAALRRMRAEPVSPLPFVLAALAIALVLLLLG